MARIAFVAFGSLLATALVLPAPASATTLAPHAVATGPASVTFVAEVFEVCVGTLAVATVAVDSVTDSFVVEVTAANPACSYHHVHAGDPADRACTFDRAGNVACAVSTPLGYLQFTLSAGGAFHLTSMGPSSWTVFGDLVRV